eukprot:gnl/MRDRNA2_/MRDRNA2_35183_c0_seq1.p1 gnl/MRDRNA2_/MRDRNA2_35183_c0~~gnl/MRDRNA2_/MRDRNA2_35183_c0_seq1.p1  ORF type:complete len:472 (+),score=98.89 gnl/MRDRNA2_/MRDRNA2_35183_c0_seq1:56-1471(+)
MWLIQSIALVILSAFVAQANHGNMASSNEQILDELVNQLLDKMVDRMFHGIVNPVSHTPFKPWWPVAHARVPISAWQLPASRFHIPNSHSSLRFSASSHSSHSFGGQNVIATKAAAAEAVFDDKELDAALKSFSNLVDGDSKQVGDWNMDALRSVYKEKAHTTHKIWQETEKGADELAGILGGPDDTAFRKVFTRVLEGGHWDDALKAVASREGKPWAVLVTGVNGIRKTTSIYSPWFKDVLREALGSQYDGPIDSLPTGANTFFRQLDYIVATLANEEFRQLYYIKNVDEYASKKDAIFSRYRKAAEMVGILLVKAAKEKGLNVMVESSGRDIAMFEYVDYCFSDEQYRKLVVHFTVNDIAFAEKSVEKRMEGEMLAGQTALKSLLEDSSSSGAAASLALVEANAGGPYGPAVLKSVQKDSDAVAARVAKGEDTDAGKGWLKAKIVINASEGDWTAQAESSDKKYPFTRK